MLGYLVNRTLLMVPTLIGVAVLIFFMLRVVPGDIVVADGDGAVVIPQALVDAVTEAAVEQERLEGWIMQEVGKGLVLPGLYPANAETKARYDADKAAGRV